MLIYFCDSPDWHYNIIQGLFTVIDRGYLQLPTSMLGYDRYMITTPPSKVNCPHDHHPFVSYFNHKKMNCPNLLQTSAFLFI